jgi:hypothetical protein
MVGLRHRPYGTSSPRRAWVLPPDGGRGDHPVVHRLVGWFKVCDTFVVADYGGVRVPKRVYALNSRHRRSQALIPIPGVLNEALRDKSCVHERGVGYYPNSSSSSSTSARQDLLGRPLGAGRAAPYARERPRPFPRTGRNSCAITPRTLGTPQIASEEKQSQRRARKNAAWEQARSRERRGRSRRRHRRRHLAGPRDAPCRVDGPPPR